MGRKLNDKEEKYLEHLFKGTKVKGLYFFLLITVLPGMAILEWLMGNYVKGFDPIQSRDRYWMAGVLMSWLFIFLMNFWGMRKVARIIKKLRAAK